MTPKYQPFGSTILYARVSTKTQDLSMQLYWGKRLAAKLGISESDLIILTDHGISARKTKLHQRPKLNEAMKIITQGKVGTFITYDRCRIARNAEQYIRFHQLCMRNRVQMLLSKSKVAPVTEDIASEARLALDAQRDGNLIAERSRDGQIYYPKAPFGYVRIGQRGEKHYEQTPEIELIKELFKAFDLVTTVMDYKLFEHTWSTRGIDATSTLCNLFYSAHTLKNNEPESLTHVVGIVPLETVLSNRRKLLEMGQWSTKKATAPYEPQFPEIAVCCGECGEDVKITHRQGKAMYQCNHGTSGSRNRLSVEAELVDSALSQALNDLINHLSDVKIKSIAQATATNMLNGIKEHLRTLTSQLRVAREQLIRCSGGPELIFKCLQDCVRIEQEIAKVGEEQNDLERVIESIVRLRDDIKRSLTSNSPNRLHELGRVFISNIVVHKDTIKLVYKGADFFDYEEAR